MARKKKDPLERVYTPPALAEYCVGLLPWEGVHAVLEPSAGAGAFLDAVEPLLGYAPAAIDVDPEAPVVLDGRARVVDFLMPGSVDAGWDRVIGNPPFDDAEKHVTRALEVAREVAFLLPISRLDALERCAWWHAAPVRHVWLLAERVWPGSRQIGFFWFERGWRGPRTWDVVSWRPPRKRAPRPRK